MRYQVVDNLGNHATAEDLAAAATAAKTLFEDDEDVSGVIIIKQFSSQEDLEEEAQRITREVNEQLQRLMPPPIQPRTRNTLKP